MAKVLFFPAGVEVEAEAGAKVLRLAVKNKIEIRFGCGACRCGTCAVKVDGTPEPIVSAMSEQEAKLLSKMGLSTDGSIRLACQARVMDSDLRVDISFQDTYSGNEVKTSS